MNPARIAEAADSIQYLRDHGYTDLIDAIADPENYLSTGKINASAVARVLDVVPQTVINRLARCRKILEEH